MPNPPNNNDLQREKVRFLNNSLSLQRVIKQGSIANSSRDNVVPPAIPSTPQPTASITPTPSVTPTITPTASLTPTITPTNTPTPTTTNTPTITPTATTTPTISITPSITLTVSITPTITITPSVTPDYSNIALQPLTAIGQDIYITNISNYNYPDNDYNINAFNGLYYVSTLSAYDITTGAYSIIQKYQDLDNYSLYLNGASEINNFNWLLAAGSPISQFNIFQSPLGLGDASLLPLSGYQQANTNIPFNIISGVKTYPDYKFSSLFARTTAISAVIVRGLTGSMFNNSLSTVNGIILEREINQNGVVEYFSTQSNPYFDLVSLYYVSNDRCWYLDFSPNEEYTSVYVGFTASPSFRSFQIPFSGFKMRGDALSYNETFFRELSGQINQPNLQLLNADELYLFRPSPTPTATPTVTPTISPTISLTPTITPTVSLTPTLTPTISLTPSVTPSITPTISNTPTLTPTISVTPSITVTVTPTRPTPTPTPTSRTDTLPISTVYLSAFGFYGDMGEIEYGITYDFTNIPVLLQKTGAGTTWATYYEPYNCDVYLQQTGGIPRWTLGLTQLGEYGFGVWVIASNNQSLSAIPLKNWTFFPGSSGGVIILNG